jgi:hypothetical protein
MFARFSMAGAYEGCIHNPTMHKTCGNNHMKTRKNKQYSLLINA